ncbi:MAG: phosphate ABC transporter permease PstA [Hyphomicrobiales bacterium]|nr:phosphate ABC transporter permease PstA [Hyphomicrobiales bacterium]
MTDITAASDKLHNWASKENTNRVRARYAADRRLQIYGIAAISFAILVLAILVGSLIASGASAFFQSKATLTFFLDPNAIDKNDISNANFRKIVNDTFSKLFPDVTAPKQKSDLQKILSTEVRFTLRDYVVANPDKIGQSVTLTVPLSDPFDQLYKGVVPPRLNALSDQEKARFENRLKNRGLIDVVDGRSFAKINVYIDPAKVVPEDIAAGGFQAILLEGIDALFPNQRVAGIYAIFDDAAAEAIKQHVMANPGVIGQTVENLLVPVSPFYDTLNKGQNPQIPNPRIGGENEIKWFEQLKGLNVLSSPFSTELFLNSNSRFPEQAGLSGAIVGSFYALMVCFLISFPTGIAAAVYLEEFAPKNRWTDLIEVNINNLAAVPSIVFGLLGLAVFLNLFGLPRSAPLVGGMVLSLLTLPTIIIATRAALKSVPPSIRQAALGIGASKHQVVMHHVLPLAMPGILTGTIIGMAHALGETAPLLLIGMNAFITSAPGDILEAATALPAQIYSWSDSPERGFVARTSAAILILLGFLVFMNGIAIFLRQKFERKW